MDLETPVKIQKLQEALHAKAKASPDYRFYLLYDKVYRADILAFAWQRCCENGGVAGVDGQTFEDIAKYGVDRWLDELTQALRTKTYHPEAVRRVWIPKPDGSKRPLGIPTIRDRVVQTALLLVLDPIFEADLQPEQYAAPTHPSQHSERLAYERMERADDGHLFRIAIEVVVGSVSRLLSTASRTRS